VGGVLEMKEHIEDSKTKRFVHLAIGLLLGATVLTGCGPKELTNDEIIAESNKCMDAGFRANVLRNGWDWSVIGVQCLPKDYVEKS
jgi:hypothetical protein